MHPLIIGAPFGNYSMFQLPNATPTLGTFTLDYRAGWLKRLWKIASTLSYERRMGGWVNKLGLPNPGISWLLSHVSGRRINLGGKIVSISTVPCPDRAGELGQFESLLDVCTFIVAACDRQADEARDLGFQMPNCHPLAWELNISCPNVGKHDHAVMHSRAAAELLKIWADDHNQRVIIKLPPVSYEKAVWNYSEAGFNYFHASNTIPCRGGGLSGPTLRPFTLGAIAFIKRTVTGPVTVIAGGGVQKPDDAEIYTQAGAGHVSIASMLLNPFCGERCRQLSAWSRNRVLAAIEKE